jgi:hypothetical protein
MAIEIVFRLKENGEDYLFWMMGSRCRRCGPGPG